MVQPTCISGQDSSTKFVCEDYISTNYTNVIATGYNYNYNTTLQCSSNTSKKKI
jgi:hypothetical protein